MDIRSEIKHLVSLEATTLTKVAERMSKEKGTKMQLNNLSKKLRNNTIKFSEVDAIADLLGYDIKFEKRK